MGGEAHSYAALGMKAFGSGGRLAVIVCTIFDMFGASAICLIMSCKQIEAGSWSRRHCPPFLGPHLLTPTPPAHATASAENAAPAPAADTAVVVVTATSDVTDKAVDNDDVSPPIN